MKKIVVSFLVLSGIMAGCANATKDKAVLSEYQQKHNEETKVEKKEIIAVTKENGKEKLEKKEVEVNEEDEGKRVMKRALEMKKFFEGK